MKRARFHDLEKCGHLQCIVCMGRFGTAIALPMINMRLSCIKHTSSLVYLIMISFTYTEVGYLCTFVEELSSAHSKVVYDFDKF